MSRHSSWVRRSSSGAHHKQLVGLFLVVAAYLDPISILYTFGFLMFVAGIIAVIVRAAAYSGAWAASRGNRHTDDGHDEFIRWWVTLRWHPDHRRPCGWFQ